VIFAESVENFPDILWKTLWKTLQIYFAQNLKISAIQTKNSKACVKLSKVARKKNSSVV